MISFPFPSKLSFKWTISWVYLFSETDRPRGSYNKRTHWYRNALQTRFLLKKKINWLLFFFLSHLVFIDFYSYNRPFFIIFCLFICVCVCCVPFPTFIIISNHNLTRKIMQNRHKKSFISIHKTGASSSVSRKESDNKW